MTTKPIRRPSRIAAVWLTYRTRWFLWLLLAGAACVYVPTLLKTWPAQDFVRSAFPDPPEPWPRANLFLDDGRNSHGPTPDWSTLRSLTLSSNPAKCQPLWTPGAMPKLESLKLFAGVSDEQLVRLCELYDLRALSLFGSGALTDAGLERLAAEPRLEYLSLGNVYNPAPQSVPGESPEAVQQRATQAVHWLHNAPVLRWPASLRVLEFDDTLAAPPARLSEWRSLPHLHTLGTRLFPRDGEHLPEETLESLRGLPALRRLYLTEAGPHAPRFLEATQADLPRLRVRPMNYNPTRGLRTAVILAGALILILPLLIQLSTQFVTPGSLLTPRFWVAHLWVFGTALTLVVMGTCAALIAAECPVSVALALCGAPLLIVAAFAKLIRQLSSFPLPGFTNFGFAMPGLVFPIVGLQLLSVLFGAEFNWFLRCQHPWLAVGLLAASVWGAVDFVAWHFRLPRDLEEAGCANVPLGMFDIGGWTEWGRSVAAVREAKGLKTPLALRGRDAELDRLAEALQSRQPITSHQLWKLGNAQSTLRFAFILSVFFSTGMFAWYFAMTWATGSAGLPWGETGAKVLWPAMAQFVLMMPMFAFAMAWQRRPMFALELLRPLSRRDWIESWFRGIAGELASLLLIVAMLASLAAWQGLFDNWTVTQLALIAAGALVVLSFIAGLGLWFLATTSFWSTLLTVVVGALLTFAGIYASAMLADQYAQTNLAQTPALWIALLFVLAFVSLRFAWWRWSRLEVGQIV